MSRACSIYRNGRSSLKQRVGIARALAIEPKVLLLDEPFGALDALTRAHLQDELMKIVEATKSTVVMVTHDIDDAVLLSDRVVMMTNGPGSRTGEIVTVDLPRPRNRLALSDDPRYLRCRHALLEFLYQKQMKVAACVRVRTAGVGPRRHPGQPHLAHQPLYPLAIDAVAGHAQEYHHLAAAVERAPRVLPVDQATEHQINFVDWHGPLPRIDRGARYACQNALLRHAYPIFSCDPRLACHHGLIPDFFLSQSSSTFNLPIALYSRSRSWCAATGFGPRLPSNSVLACS